MEMKLSRSSSLVTRLTVISSPFVSMKQLASRAARIAMGCPVGLIPSASQIWTIVSRVMDKSYNPDKPVAIASFTAADHGGVSWGVEAAWGVQCGVACVHGYGR